MVRKLQARPEPVVSDLATDEDGGDRPESRPGPSPGSLCCAIVIGEGRRERKKRRTREAIVATALALFAQRGFEAVTVAEIAEQADVARATVFSYFPTKESIVLGLLGDDDPAAIVAARARGTTPLDALRAHYRALAEAGGVDPDGDLGPLGGPDAPDLLTSVRVIEESPTLRAGVYRLRDAQQAALAQALKEAAGEGELRGRADLGAAHEPHIRAELAAAQICAVIGALKSDFFGRLAAGESFEQAAARLPGHVELAFHLLERGLGAPRSIRDGSIERPYEPHPSDR
jgi:AcrR family transcriptional regulator